MGNQNTIFTVFENLKFIFFNATLNLTTYYCYESYILFICQTWKYIIWIFINTVYSLCYESTAPGLWKVQSHKDTYKITTIIISLLGHWAKHNNSNGQRPMSFLRLLSHRKLDHQNKSGQHHLSNQGEKTAGMVKWVFPMD